MVDHSANVIKISPCKISSSPALCNQPIKYVSNLYFYHIIGATPYKGVKLLISIIFSRFVSGFVLQLNTKKNIASCCLTSSVAISFFRLIGKSHESEVTPSHNWRRIINTTISLFGLFWFPFNSVFISSGHCWGHSRFTHSTNASQYFDLTYFFYAPILITPLLLPMSSNCSKTSFHFFLFSSVHVFQDFRKALLNNWKLKCCTKGASYSGIRAETCNKLNQTSTHGACTHLCNESRYSWALFLISLLLLPSWIIPRAWIAFELTSSMMLIVKIIFF